jgi:solute carrier family 50 protein (sugar transporter)
MFLSGFSEIMKVRKEGKLGSFNPDPMPILFGNCLGWLTYSFLVKDKFVAIANVPGVLLGLFYSMTMLRLAEPTKGKQLEKMMLLMTGVHVAAGITCAFFLPDRAAMTSLYGLINNAILLMYYGAPLTTIGTVLKSKTSDSIFFPTVALNGLNGV